MEQTNPPHPDTIRRHLLGMSAPAEGEQIERRLLADPAFYDEVSACEDELLDEYVGGRLAARERENFERVFLAAPDRRQKLRFALALRRHIDAADAPPSPADVAPPPANVATPPANVAPPPASRAPRAPRPTFFGGLGRPARLGLASVVLAAAAGAILSAVRAPWRQAAPPADRAAVGGAANATRPRESPASPAPASPPDTRADARANTVAVTLKPGLTRGDAGGTNRVEIRPGVELVRLELLIASAGHASYHATVRNVEGRAVADLTSLAADSAGGAPSVVVELPASALAPDDYRVKLSGLHEGGDPEPVATYNFRVSHP